MSFVRVLAASIRRACLRDRNEDVREAVDENAFRQ